MNDDLKNLLDRVVDEDSFLVFARALQADWRRTQHPGLRVNPDGPGSWETSTIGDFLESAVAWAEDSKAAPMVPPPSSNPWRRCADMLWAGAFYE